jgi:hypothetical protein
MERPREHAHRQYEDMAVAHVLGGLDTGDGRTFRSHLVDCHFCRARVGELRAIAHDLADVERDERRAAERRRVDTKPVEIDVDDPPVEDPPPSRRLFLLAVAGLLVLIALLSWNFVLRSNTTRLELHADQLEQAAVAIEFGEPWQVTYPESSGGVRAAISMASGDLSLLLENAENTVHRLEFVDGVNRKLDNPRMLTPRNGRWLDVVGEVPPAATGLVITRSQTGAPDATTRVTVLEASLP